jgi:GntR family transcriptional regulator/MocR family aminotransferase
MKRSVGVLNSHFEVKWYDHLRFSMKRALADFPLTIALDQGGETPIYRQLYDWFQRAIVEGRLRPGQRVPSTRSLAAELKISRIPVLTAFEQLHAEGYLESVIGAGTRVAPAMPEQTVRLPPRKPSEPRDEPRTRRVSHAAEAAMASGDSPQSFNAFRVSQPALDAFPTGVWSSILARHARRPAPELMEYSDPMGYAPFREAIAEYLGVARAVRCDASQVMIVAGSQQGLQIAARALLDPGDAVWVEEPGYFGAHRAFGMAGAELTPVPTDGQGLDVQEGVRLRGDARAAYVTPSHQYPLGVTMSASRRIRLLNWASEVDAWIFEDDYDSEFRFASRPIASLQGVDEDRGVIYLGTLSKVLFPALRIGYLVIPKDLVEAFRCVRMAMDIFPSMLFQAALNDFIREGHFARHIRRMRMLYMSRCETLVGAIQRHLGGRLQLVSAQAGMHLAGFLPSDVDDTVISRRAFEAGVSAMPLSACYLSHPARSGLVLGYGGADDAAIEHGVAVLAGILRDQA